MYPIKVSKKRGFSPSEERGFYSKEIREHLVESGALSNEEDGFMQGYEEALEED